MAEHAGIASSLSSAPPGPSWATLQVPQLQGQGSGKPLATCGSWVGPTKSRNLANKMVGYNKSQTLLDLLYQVSYAVTHSMLLTLPSISLTTCFSIYCYFMVYILDCYKQELFLIFNIHSHMKSWALLRPPGYDNVCGQKDCVICQKPQGEF